MTKRNQMMSSNRRIISPDLEPDSQNIYHPVKFSALSMCPYAHPQLLMTGLCVFSRNTKKGDRFFKNGPV